MVNVIQPRSVVVVGVGAAWLQRQLWLFLLTVAVVRSCTDILVTPGASLDGSALISYNADSPTLYGVLYHYPAAAAINTSATTTSARRKIYNWDTGRYMGEIDEVVVNGTTAATYNVVGNSNEHGLIIGETTFGGVPLLAWNQTGAILDYGSLIYLTLQRCQAVKEAITTMVDLMDQYGYASGGESFSLADRSGDVWMMEVISRGNDYGRKGAVWVAQKIPDGAVAAHANQARIRTFPRDDPDHCQYAPDVVDVAVFYGLYPATADPLDFSFSDVYDPVDFIQARQGEARVWSIFSRIADTTGNFQAKYQSYALGEDLSNRMPLYIVPYQKLSLDDVMQLMASHYEGTRLDSSLDVGAGLFETPYRPRPLEWQYQNVTYHNERSVATSKTGWNFVGQVRPWMPASLSALLWFACDDSSTSPRVPVYGSSTRISPAYAGMGPQDGVVSPLLKLDLTKAFWVQNMVSNLAYYRWKDIYPILRQKIDQLQSELAQKVAIADERAMTAYDEDGVDAAVSYVTSFSYDVGNTVHQLWMDFYGELFVQFRDFYTIVPKEGDALCGCEAKEPGLSEIAKKRIVEETGDHYKVVKDDKAVPILRGDRGGLEQSNVQFSVIRD